MEAESFQNNNRYFWMKFKTEYSNELRQGAVCQNTMTCPFQLMRQDRLQVVAEKHLATLAKFKVGVIDVGSGWGLVLDCRGLKGF